MHVAEGEHGADRAENEKIGISHVLKRSVFPTAWHLNFELSDYFLECILQYFTSYIGLILAAGPMITTHMGLGMNAVLINTKQCKFSAETAVIKAVNRQPLSLKIVKRVK